MPNAICVTLSDGGRGQDNGDNACNLTMISGPKDRIINGFVQNRRVVNYDTLGFVKGYKLTGSNDLESGVYPEHVLSLALNACGISTGIPYPEGVLTSPA